MRRAFLASAVLAGALLAAACSDQRSPLPTEPPVSPSFTASQCPRPVELAILILQLFAPRDLLLFAAQMHSDINLRMSRGDVAGARRVVLAFIDFTLKTYYQGKLRDPNGPTPPGTDFFVLKLIDGLLCWVGLPPSGLTLGPAGSSGTSVTTKVIGAGGGQLVANDGLSALQVPAGAVSADRLWVITRRDDLARLRAGCVTTSLEQIPLCVDFSVVPAQDLAQPVLVQICQPEDDHPAGRRLAHQLADNRIELLTEPPTPPEGQPPADPFHLACLNLPTFPPVGLSPVGKALWQFGSLVTRVFGPKPAYASHSGLGGLVAPKLSNITAVRVRLGFMQQPTNTAPEATITPPVTVAFLQVGTEGDVVATEVTNPIRVQIGTNPAGGTLSGTTTQPPTSGVSTFADLSINNTGVGYTLVADALSSSATGSVPLGIPATSDPFDITTTLVNCPGTPGGDQLDRGFYVPQFPGIQMDKVTLHFSASAAGTYTFSLTARTGTYDGAVLGTATATATLTADILANVATTFTFSPVAVIQGSTVTFAITEASGPEGGVVFYSVPVDDPSCPVVQTNGTAPPLDTQRRNGVHVTIDGGAPVIP